jgi:hypothetical protein
MVTARAVLMWSKKFRLTAPILTNTFSNKI